MANLQRRTTKEGNAMKLGRFALHIADRLLRYWGEAALSSSECHHSQFMRPQYKMHHTVRACCNGFESMSGARTRDVQHEGTMRPQPIRNHKICPCASLVKHCAMKKYGVIAPTFLTSAVDGGGWSASRPRPLYPGERLPVPIGYEAGWAPESVWMTWRREKSCIAGNRTRAFQPVAIPTELSRLLIGNHYLHYYYHHNHYHRHLDVRVFTVIASSSKYYAFKV
jgi:hypothetical protein